MSSDRQPSTWGCWGAALCLVLCMAWGGPSAVSAQDYDEQALVTLDFADAELADVIETIARATNRNFIYDDRVRGRVTIVSPDPVPVDQAYAVFESVLQVKGFTTVTTPGGAIKVVPIREAKESSIETVRSSRRPPNRDRFVTRLIPLRYIDANSIVDTLKPLVSKDAAMAAYAPTNTVILTESSSNIRRLIAILESIDVETYKEELAVINVVHADASTLAEQVSEIYGAEVSQGAARTRRAARRRNDNNNPAAQANKPPVRIITDERTNSLLVLAPRAALVEVRRLVAKLDVPVTGGGRIHVYYLNNANAEEMAETLSGLLGGGGGSTTTTTSNGTPGQGAQAIRTAVTGLSDGINVSADPATNSLIIQASLEGFNTLAEVIKKLDVERPQVSVEALIMELTVNDDEDIGFSGLLQAINGDTNLAITTATTAGASGVPVAPIASAVGDGALPLVGRLVRDSRDVDAAGNRGGSGTIIDQIINLSASNGDVNIVSAPHILTSDNEQAEIRVGDNIPIISSRVESAQGQTDGLATSVNVERQDIGVTLRVTPQITEGDSLRMEIFQEITEINSNLAVGNVNDVGVALSNRRIENTVVVRDGETVVIGGLLSDVLDESVTKVPWLGDIPFLGWAFKSTNEEIRKTNLLVFLTPRIVRTPLDLEHDTIRRREEFREHSTGRALTLNDSELDEEAQRIALAREQGVPYEPDYHDQPVRERLAKHSARYPSDRMKEIERAREEKAAGEEAAAASRAFDRYMLQAAILSDPQAAQDLLTDLIDSGHDGTLVSAQFGDSVIYEVHLGPYATLDDANRIGEAVRRSHGLAPAVLIRDEEEANE
ncbi:MAG: type II secretion system secretin GspD [Myxococcota bacterium]